MVFRSRAGGGTSGRRPIPPPPRILGYISPEKLGNCFQTSRENRFSLQSWRMRFSLESWCKYFFHPRLAAFLAFLTGGPVSNSHPVIFGPADIRKDTRIRPPAPKAWGAGFVLVGDLSRSNGPCTNQKRAGRAAPAGRWPACRRPAGR